MLKTTAFLLRWVGLSAKSSQGNVSVLGVLTFSFMNKFCSLHCPTSGNSPHRSMLDITSVCQAEPMDYGEFSASCPTSSKLRLWSILFTFMYCSYVALVTFVLFATIEIHTEVEGVTPFPLAVIYLWLCSLQWHFLGLWGFRFGGRDFWAT